MTTKLQNVFERLSRLPEGKQDAVAGIIELELDGDAKWERLFAETTNERWDRLGEEIDVHREEGTIPIEDLRKLA